MHPFDMNNYISLCMFIDVCDERQCSVNWCNKCLYITPYKNSLRLHKMKHHTAGGVNKPYQCEVRIHHEKGCADYS